VNEGCIPEDWRASNLVWIYRGIKLWEHAMKVVERIFHQRIQQQTHIGDVQFGFMIYSFIVRHMQKFRAKE